MTTLLNLVQDLTSAASGDTVNSIFDTVESEQIARIVRDCYQTLLPQMETLNTYSLFELDSSGDSSKPVLMSIPSTIQRIEWLKYDGRLSTDTSYVYKDLVYVTLEDFVSSMYQLPHDSSYEFVTTINGASVDIRCRNDKAPEVFTVFDGNKVLLDSYDASVETTLQKTKTLGYGKTSSTFQLIDSFEIPLDETGIAILTQESKAQLWAELKQTENALATKKARALKVTATKNKPSMGYEGYGRRVIK